MLRFATFLAFLTLLLGCQRTDPTPSGWQVFISRDFKFKVKLPSNYEEKKLPEFMKGKALDVSANAEQGAFEVFVTMTPPKSSKEEWDAYRDAMLANENSKLISEAEVLHQDKYPGRIYEVELPDGKLRIRQRIFFAHGMVYSAKIFADVGADAWRFADLFFNSLEILP